jgi:hypothetical protein
MSPILLRLMWWNARHGGGARAVAGAAVELAEPTLALLYERTEGWAARLRLAASSLAGHPEPERLAAEFSGSERTVAEYLLAEVLGRPSLEVQRLLLRTSVLEQVNGTASRWRRSVRPRQRGTGAWPPGSSPTTGPACTSQGRP